MKWKSFRIRYVILILLFVILAAPFVLWQSKGSKYLDIVVLNKTFPIQTSASGEVQQLDYSKQRGLFWLLGYMGIKQPESKKTYDFNRDYYGNFLVNGQLENKPLDHLATVPDMIYLSDMYGTGNSRVNGVEPAGVSGMTDEEIAVIATSYEKGTTVVGEYNIAGDPTKSNVSQELESIFGLHYTGLAGKFFSDLSSTADVPNWIRAIYEQQYGRKWTMTGAGIVIAGNNNIVVLQRDIGFTGRTLQVSMTEENTDIYHTKETDYYNWFEIVEPVNEASVIAWYDLNLTAEGEEQLKPFGLGNKLPAIIANQADGKHSYYMAGDFTDYRAPDKIKQFLGAAALYRYFSIDNEGDLSYFYWHFYVPFMTTVLQELKPLDQSLSYKGESEKSSDGSQLVSIIEDGQFSVYRNGSWNKMYVKGVDIGAITPGSGSLPDDPAFYKDWFEKIADMNANTIRVYTLMPSVFYRALDAYNFNHPDKRLYLLQNISTAQDASVLDSDYGLSYQEAIKNTIDALHGNATIVAGQDKDVYKSDVSGYVLGYLADPGLSMEAVAATDAANGASEFSGDYASASANATPTEAWLASMVDNIYQYEQNTYSIQHPIGVVSSPEMDSLYSNRFGSIDDTASAIFTMDHINVSGKVTSGLFGAPRIFPNQLGFSEGSTTGTLTSFTAFSEYLNDYVKAQKKYPVLISEFGLPSSNGWSEEEQGEGIASLLAIIKGSGAMGGLIYEWTDEWGKSSEAAMDTMIPYKRGVLWHNMVDPAQHYGIMAMESAIPTEYSTNMRGLDPLDTLSLTADESYLYMRADFSKLPDFDKQSIMIYLDTIDRKNGEYMLGSNRAETWSGVEFSLQLDNPNKAELLVIPSYNAAEGSYYTAVSTKGLFERMKKEISPAYVTKTGEKVNAVYEDASALNAGPFENSSNSFYVENNQLNVRIPWSRLNFSDPSSLLVINDDQNKGKMMKKDALTVRMTDGIAVSLLIMNKGSKSVEYLFPESITSSGYKVFTWNTWDMLQYEQRLKSSYDRIKLAYAD